MIYAYDQWLPMPTKDLFDTQMMLASVSAAKDMYEKGLEEMKEFNKEYVDFTSPISSHMDWINENAIKPVRDAINEMYANGIDPLRSREGRALLSKLRNNVDLGTMAMIKSSAEIAKQYQKSADRLKEKNLFDPDYEKWRLGGKDFNNWSVEDGMWTESSAMPLRDIDSIVEPWVVNLKPSFDEELTKAKNDGYLWKTVSEDRVRAVVDDILPEFTKTNEGGYYRYLAEETAKKTGQDPDEILKQWMYNRASDHTTVDKEVDPIYKMERQGQIDARIASIRHSSTSGDGGGNGKGAPSVFREADSNMRQYNASMLNQRGWDVGYDRFEDPHYQWIDPVAVGVRAEKADNGAYVYYVPSSCSYSVYVANNTYGSNKNTLSDAGIQTKDRYFIPSGSIHKEIANGQNHYYITGMLTTGVSRQKDENGNKKDYEYVQRSDGSGVALFDMEVTERDYNYAKKQASVNSPSN